MIDSPVSVKNMFCMEKMKEDCMQSLQVLTLHVLLHHKGIRYNSGFTLDVINHIMTGNTRKPVNNMSHHLVGQSL